MSLRAAVAAAAGVVESAPARGEMAMVQMPLAFWVGIVSAYNDDPARAQAQVQACVKCGKGDVPPRFHATRMECLETSRLVRARQEGPHLHFVCDCGFSWTAPTLDAQAEETPA